MKQYMSEFICIKAEGLINRTIKTYKSFIKGFINDFLGEVQLVDILFADPLIH